MENTTIAVTKNIQEEIKKFGNKGETYSEIIARFIESAKKHQYFHLQIGAHTPMTNDLRNSNLCVEQILKAEDLARKTIDLTDKIFRGEN